MLIRDSLSYLLARGMPALMNMLTLGIYTRLMPANQYGIYSTVIAAMSIASTILYQWLNQGTLRFYPDLSQNRSHLLSNIAIIFLALVFLSILICPTLFLWTPSPEQGVSIVYVALLSGAQGWFTISLGLANIQLNPARFGLLAWTRAFLLLILGVFFLTLGWGANGALSAMLISLLAASLMFGDHWGVIEWGKRDRAIVCKLFQYCAPLAVVSLMSVILEVSDRFLLGWLVSMEVVGRYSPGYEFSQQAVLATLGIVNLAGGARILSAYETEGENEVRAVMDRYYLIMLMVGLPSVLFIMLTAENLSSVALGRGEEEARIMRWIAPAILFGCLKTYYYDQSFILAKQTKTIAYIVFTAAVVNFAANLLLIPSFGSIGAAYSSLLSFASAALASLLIGRSIFKVPLYPKEWWKVVLSVLVMAACLLPFLNHSGPVMLCLQLIMAGGVYLAMLFAVNVDGFRDRLKKQTIARSN